VVDTLSKGYRQRTCFAQALLHDPPILILDEPTEGLDPNQKAVVREMIREMGRQKVIVLSTHVLEEVEAICSRVLIISNGKLVMDSTPQDLKRRSRQYNVTTLQVVAPETEAAEAFRGLSEAAEVEVVDRSEERQTLRIVPKNGQSIAGAALDLARTKQWMVTDMQTDSGRLDDVFRRLTVTEDVENAVGKGDS
jgi:ABC-2 type transport system ATP-binding protein